MHRKLAGLRAPRSDLSPEAQAVALIAECFRLSLSRSAIYVLREQFDVHDADQAKPQPKLFTDAGRQHRRACSAAWSTRRSMPSAR